MLAMILKEFRQLRRDHRTLLLMILLPVLLLIVFGYAASFNVKSIPTWVGGPEASLIKGHLPAVFHVKAAEPGEGYSQAAAALTDGSAAVAFVASGRQVDVLVDGTQLFIAQAAQRLVANMEQVSPGQVVFKEQVLFNPQLKTSDVMIPGLSGMILLFIGMVITSLGVVRERQAGTLEQLAVMPIKPRDVFIGKILPYFIIGAIDMLVVVVVGVVVFGVPFRGSILVFGAGTVLFLFVSLGMGVLISSVSQNQGQAIQLAIMALLPQIMLSGLIFPLSSMAAGVRWIGYILPLTYFVEIARGVMLRNSPIGSLWQPFLYLAVLGSLVFTLATLRFRRALAPSARRRSLVGKVSSEQAAR